MLYDFFCGYEIWLNAGQYPAFMLDGASVESAWGGSRCVL